MQLTKTEKTIVANGHRVDALYYADNAFKRVEWALSSARGAQLSALNGDHSGATVYEREASSYMERARVHFDAALYCAQNLFNINNS